jgi:hypothetical protein
MAEIKNAFTQARMNKDIDSRLLPNGEYRNAVNAQVSTSEGSDVGTLQNILGNKFLVSLVDGIEGLKSIGFYADQLSNYVYVFLTDEVGDTSDPYAYNPAANNYICSYNVQTQAVAVLVSGAFLNFSQLFPIHGVNLLENLLFWTDNRNQPRKINVVSASNSSTYYTREEQISVAKINPYEPIRLWQESTLDEGSYETSMKDVSTKYLPNGGEAINALEVFELSTFLITGISGTITSGVNVGRVDSAGQIIPLDLTVVSYNALEEEITLSGDVTLEAGTTLVFSINPYYNYQFPGDSDFLKDRFVRFSYRFRFDDGEYSILAPFTQIAYIPQQDGYFTQNEDLDIDDEEATYRSTIVPFMRNKVTQILLSIPLPALKSNIKNELKITELDVMYKESDGLSLKVIESIPIDTVVADALGEVDTYIYTYNSTKPYKTLPSNEITRVYDKVPVRALAQEIISNRVVYGNYQDKHTPLPLGSSLDYNVAVSTKYDFDVTVVDPVITNNFTSIIEYPNHSLKQNRSYQVGVVLSDRYGRQTSVLLPSNNNTISVEGQSFSGSTVYAPYLNELISPTSWPGYSLKMLFNSLIPESPDATSNYPGVYNGDPLSADYNPLGWHSYKIVVKQTEQDYYNVYLPGVCLSYPYETTKELGKTSHAVLINDNINKVPRDLSEVGPTQRQFRSSVKLYGRVDSLNVTSATDPSNVRYYPGRTPMIVSTIADNDDLFGADVVPAPAFYNVDSNPLIARISTPKLFGTAVAWGLTDGINLAVAETAPVSSLLDIFWETTTTGSVVELNAAIEANSGTAIKLSTFNSDGFTEAIETGDDVLTGGFGLTDGAGAAIDNTDRIIESLTMTVSTYGDFGGDVTSYFDLQEDPDNPLDSDFPRWFIKVTSDFYDNVYFRGTPRTGLNKFKFDFIATVSGLARNLSKDVLLKNISPIIITDPEPLIITNPTVTEITDLRGNNGASNPALYTQEPLEWILTSVTNLGGTPVPSGWFSVQNSPLGLPSLKGTLINNVYPGTIIPPFTYIVKMRIQDAGGVAMATTREFNIKMGVTPVSVKQWEYSSAGGRTVKFVTLQVNDPELPDLNDYYSFKGSWANLTSGATDNVILISASAAGCSMSNDWLRGSDESTLVLDTALCMDDPGMFIPTSTTITVSPYLFSFGV